MQFPAYKNSTEPDGPHAQHPDVIEGNAFGAYEAEQEARAAMDAMDAEMALTGPGVVQDRYGTRELNPLSDRQRQAQEQAVEKVSWTDKRLKRITRLRLVSDPGYPVWDLSYCFGELKDGTPVEVGGPFHELPKRNYRREIVNRAKAAGVYAKGLGIFEAISTLC